MPGDQRSSDRNAAAQDCRGPGRKRGKASPHMAVARASSVSTCAGGRPRGKSEGQAGGGKTCRDAECRNQPCGCSLRQITARPRPANLARLARPPSIRPPRPEPSAALRPPRLDRPWAAHRATANAMRQGPHAAPPARRPRRAPEGPRRSEICRRSFSAIFAKAVCIAAPIFCASVRSVTRRTNTNSRTRGVGTAASWCRSTVSDRPLQPRAADRYGILGEAHRAHDVSQGARPPGVETVQPLVGAVFAKLVTTLAVVPSASWSCTCMVPTTF